MEVLGVILAVFAIVLALGIELLKRPRLQIGASPWRPSRPVTWAFAAVSITNRQLPRPLRWLTRESAQGCSVSIDFFHWDRDDRAIPTVPGRWSSHVEPLRRAQAPSTVSTAAPYSGGTATPAVVMVDAFEYDHTLAKRDNDVGVSDEGEEVSVAILTENGAYAWGNESYAHDGWGKPEWRLPHGTYRVVVTVKGSSVSRSAAFKLEYLDEDFAKFQLRAI